VGDLGGYIKMVQKDVDYATGSIKQRRDKRDG
jgi:hypothetical protein